MADQPTIRRRADLEPERARRSAAEDDDPRGDAGGARAPAIPPSEARVPPLVGFATLAAMVDLLVGQVAVRLLPEGVSHADRLGLLRAGDLARNAAALASCFALGYLLWDLLRRPRWAPAPRRMLVASFGGLFLPSALIALLSPHARVSMMVVMMGIGSGSVLAVLLALTPVRFRAPPVLRAGLFGLGLGALLAFSALALRISVLGTRTAPLQETVRHVGEVLHLGALVALGWALAPLPPRGLRDRAAVGLGLAAALVAGLALARAPAALGPDYEAVLYGMQRVSLWIETAPLAYALLLGPIAGLGVAAALRADPAARQGGLGVLLVARAGFAPRSLDALLALTLGAAVLARAALALAERRVAAEASGDPRQAGDGALRRAPADGAERLSPGAPPPPGSA